MTDYHADKARAKQRAEQILQQQRHYALVASLRKPNKSNNNGASLLVRRGLTLSFSIITLIAMLLILINTTNAQGLEPNAGYQGEPFHKTMVAFQLGNHYFNKGQYERAVEYFTTAVESLPVEMYTFDPSFANLYVYLGDAQMAAGMDDAALKSYGRYLMYTDDTAYADVVAVVVERFSNSVMNLSGYFRGGLYTASIFLLIL